MVSATITLSVSVPISACKTYFGATHAIFPQNMKVIFVWTFAPKRVVVFFHSFPKFVLGFTQSNFRFAKSIRCLQQMLMQIVYNGPHLGF